MVKAGSSGNRSAEESESSSWKKLRAIFESICDRNGGQEVKDVSAECRECVRQ